MNSHDLIMQMRRLIAEYDKASQVPAPDVKIARIDHEKRIVSMVGLSLGEHEEVHDAGYARQKIEFTEREDGMWRNLNPVHFAVAVGTYYTDSIIIEGGDIQRKIVARMAMPIMCHAGLNGAGFAPNALSVKPDVMRDATSKQAPVSDDFERFCLPEGAEKFDWAPGKLADDSARAMAANIKASAEQLQRFMTTARWDKRPFDKWDPLEEMQKHGLLSASGLSPAPEREPEGETKPLYCDKCERISLHRRNQIASMGHMVSHLVELPNEQGYALPCKSCRER